MYQKLSFSVLPQSCHIRGGIKVHRLKPYNYYTQSKPGS